MSKNKQILIFSGIGILVLGAVTAVLMLTAPKPEADVNDDSSTASVKDDSLILSAHASTEVTGITVTNASGTYEITDSGNKNSDGARLWTIADIAQAPLVNSDLEGAVNYAVAVEAKEFVEETDDIAKYGLDNPKAVVKATFADGTDFTLLIGNDVPNSTTTVYATADGKKVYTCQKSRADVFTQDMYSYVDKKVVPSYDQSTGEEIQKLTVERIDLEEPLVIESIIPDDDDEITVYSYRLTSPYTAYADLADAPNFMYSVFGLTAKKAVWVGITDIDIKTAGLDNPNCVITVETNQHKYTVTLGNALIENTVDENGSPKQTVTGFYGISSEVPDVLYLFNYSDITAAQINPDRLISKLFLMPYIYSLNTVEYSDSEGRNFTLGFKTEKGTPTVDENGSETAGEDKHSHFLNGEEGNEQQIKNLYQYFISAAGEELYFDEDKGDLIAEIKYNYNDKADGVNGADVVRFYSSNTDRKVIINLNGENIFKTRQMYATQLFSNVEAFLNGGEIVFTY